MNSIMEDEQTPVWIYFLILFGLGFVAFIVYRLRTEERRWRAERTRQSKACSELSEMLRGKRSVD